MSTSPPPSEFNPTGVWLDHFLSESSEPPMDLFGEFVRRGGKGVILNGSGASPDLTSKAVDMVHEVGLQAMATVYYSDLRNAAMSKAGLEPIGFMVGSADAVLVIPFGTAISSNVPPEQQIQTSNVEEVDLGSVPDYGGQLPEKTWLMAVHREEIAPIPPNLYPGPLLGFLLDRDLSTDAFPTPDEEKVSIEEDWKDTVFYSVPIIDPQIPGKDVAAATEIAESVRGAGVRALSIDSRQYAEYPELRDAAESLAGFPEVKAAHDDAPVISWRADRAGGVNSVAVTSDNKRVVSGGDEGTVRVWDIESGEDLWSQAGHRDRIYSVATVDGQPGVTRGSNTVKVWSVAVTTDGRRVVSGESDGSIRVWDMESEEELGSLQGHRNGVLSVAVTADGRRIVSGGDDKTVRVWDLESGKEVRSLTGHDDGVKSVAVTPDGNRVVSGGFDGTVRVWDLESEEELRSLRGHRDAVLAVAITPDGRRVVSGGNIGPIHVWDIESGVQVESLTGRQAAVLTAAVTSDGQRVVVGGSDPNIVIWDIENGVDVRSSIRHIRMVLSLAVTSDGRSVVTAGNFGDIQVWKAPWLANSQGRQRVSASVPTDQPLDRDGIAGPDQLGYKPYAAALFQLLSNSQTGLPLSLAVSAPWGSGKTSIMNWVGVELEYHRRNVYHRCTVLPDVDNWGVVGLPFRERIKAEAGQARRRLGDLRHSVWVKGLDRAGWQRWPVWARRLVRRGPTRSSAAVEAATTAGLTRRCRTVWIDAWKYESGAALWAAFTKEIYRQAHSQLGGPTARLKFRLALANSIEPTKSGYSWFQVLRAVLWSVFKDRWTTGLALLGGVGIAVVGGLVVDAREFLEGGDAVAFGVTIGGGSFAAGLIGFAKGLIRQPFSFNLDKASAASGAHPEPVDSVSAPEDIGRMTRLLAHREDEALVVFVDDLDRCSPDKVKDAVEAINLLFNGTRGARTVFILGMDVDMVSASMQVAYRPMVAELRRVENQSASDFGYRFLGKIVQLSLNIPAPPPTAMDDYLRGLIGAEVPREEPVAETASTTAIPTNESSEEFENRLKRDAETTVAGQRTIQARNDAGDKAVRQRSPDEQVQFAQVMQQVVQRENLRDLTGDSPEVQKAIQEGSRTLPPRPRDYKRFVNAVRLQLLVANQALNLGDRHRATNEQIAKWTALGMRWPNLAAELRASPETLKDLEEWAKQCYDKGTNGWQEKPGRDQITAKTIKDNAWSRRMEELTADPDLGPALLEEPLLGDVKLHGLLSVH